MAGVPAGPDAFFSVSPAELAEPECFAVRQGAATERLAPGSNHPNYARLIERLDNASLPTLRLNELLLSIAGGATPKRSDSSLYEDSGIKFLRILNIDDGEIVEQELKYITEAVHDGLLGRSRLAANDVLLTITGRVGSAAVVKEKHLPANINQHIARLRIDIGRCRPQFLAEWLNCPAGLELSNSAVSGGTRPALTYGAIRDIRIPLPDSLEAQDALLADIDAARAERKAKLAEADALLAGIDDFVLDALGIASPQKETRRVFAVRPSQVSGEERLNAEYYHPGRTRTLSALQTTSETLRSKRLMEVAHFEREQLKTPGENYLSLAHVQGNTGELTDATNTASGNCFAFQPDDVLFARLRPYLNKVYRAEMHGCCSTEFHVLRVIDRQALLPEYLAAILRSRIVLAQTVHMMTGNTHPRLTNYDVATLTIPIPSMDIQNVVATEVNRRRNEARRLRAEAESDWEAAKARFEARLLGEYTESTICYNRI